VNGVNRLQRGEGDRMVAAQAQHRATSGRHQCGKTRPRLLDGLFDVERVGRNVTGVDDLGIAEGLGVKCRVVGAQEPRCLSDVRRPESGSWAVSDTRVERDSHHCDVVVLDVFQSGQPGKGGQARVSGHLHPVDLPDDSIVVSHVLLSHGLCPVIDVVLMIMSGAISRPAPG